MAEGNDETDGENPFLALFTSKEEAFLREQSVVQQNNELCGLLTRIFLFSGADLTVKVPLLSKLPHYTVFLPQFSQKESQRGHNGHLTLDNYSEGLSERILLCSSDFELVILRQDLDTLPLSTQTHAMEPNAMQYLAECYARAENESKPVGRKREREELEEEHFKATVINQCKREILEKASVVIRTANARAVIQSTSSSCGFVQLLKEAVSSEFSIPVQFFYDLAELNAGSLEALKGIFDVALEDLRSSLAGVQLSASSLGHSLDMVEFFSSQNALCKVLIHSKYWLPGNITDGKMFETHTILGKLLSPSCMPELPQSPSSFFPMDRRLYQSEVEDTTLSLQWQLDHHTARLFRIFDGILRASSECKKALITWLVLCFESNKDRGKMGAVFNRALAHGSQASDGFFVNLSWTLLRLCSPFMSTVPVSATRRPRVGTIDVSYCACASRREAMAADSGGPLVDFSQDSKLVLDYDGPSTPAVTLQAPFNFITHCFFLTHKCLMLGMTHVINKYRIIHRNLAHLHRMIGGFDDSEVLPRTPQWYMRSLSSQILGIKAHALHPALMELCLSFYARTADWMVQQALQESNTTVVPDQPPPIVRIIPECLVENMSNIVLALKQMDSQLTLLPHHVDSYVAFCTIYMKSSSFVNNPHIRAKLAQLMRFIIHRNETSGSALDVDVQKEQFSSHQMARNHLMAALMAVFVDIEHTGESMEFEDKFAYRLPMYEVLEFLWSLPSYHASIQKLADEVISHAETAQGTPVLLRFINMLINDAIVQLDEGLKSLATIKELEDVQNSDEWERFNAERRKEHAEKLAEASMYASNRNSLGAKTVHVIRVITTDVQKPFVIAGIVERIAAMLNYALKLLVGKENKSLKVKDFDKYHFNPRTLVGNLVTIYLNLGKEKTFCEALPRDGRSFSMDLFAQAERVLRFLPDQNSMISKWRELSRAVEECSAHLLHSEALFEDAPEEFLDPLTLELMTDPVVLPTSGHTIDRSSIVRHLLSDQLDPFNRAPLTLDMLQPNHALQERILQWKQEKLDKK